MPEKNGRASIFPTGPTLEEEVAYLRERVASLERAKRDSFLTIAALVAVAGGRVEVPRNVVAEVDQAKLTHWRPAEGDKDIFELTGQGK